MILPHFLLQGADAAQYVGQGKKLVNQMAKAGIRSKTLQGPNGATIRAEQFGNTGKVWIKTKPSEQKPTAYGNGTLIRYPYGSGIVIGTTMTLEYAYDRPSTQTGANVLINLVPYLVTSGPVLLLENTKPWESEANKTILTSKGIPYVRKTIEDAASETLGDYQKVILGGDQPTSFYQAYMTQKTKFDDYVQAGGILEWHATGFGWQYGDTKDLVLPGGVTINTDQLYYDYNYNIAPNDPLTVNVPYKISGNYASHTYLSHPSGLENVEVLIVEALDS